jgi:D-alanyl-D-alanine carboxypeptidase/D-alanyl-D-alanine-endopeptidase (penicillin-binding protein 4)
MRSTERTVRRGKWWRHWVGTRLVVMAALAVAARDIGAQASETFQSKLTEILARPEYRRSEFGVALFDLDSSQLVFAHNAGKLFTPGSTTKLLSVGTALSYFGSDFRFRTSIYRTGPVRGGRLTGDLVLVASGDPNLSGRIQQGDTLAFTNEDHSYGGSPFTKAVPGDPLFVIRKLAGQIAASGVRRIEGRVLVDATLFSGRERSTDVGGVSPIVVNDNVIDVTIGAGAAQGAPAAFTVSPDIGYVHVINEATTGPPDSRPMITRLSDATNADGSHTVRFGGNTPAGTAPVLYSYSVSDPTRFAEMALTFALKEKGVTIATPTGTTTATPDFVKIAASYTADNRIAEHVSPTFAEAAKVTLKVSQNLHASMMPYLVGALVAKKSGRDLPQAGFDLERDFLLKVGLDVESASQGDGAGGAPGAFYTPEFMVRYLAYMATRPDSQTFRRALPILGKDGTLWNIQPDAPAAGKVFAKTGTFQVPDPLNRRTIVTGKGLAGYLTTSTGRRLAICLYANRVPRPSDAAGGAALLVGQVLGEIASAAWSLPIERVTADGGGAIAWRDPAPHRVRMIAVTPNVNVEVLDFGGTGEVILFLHGYGNTAHSFDDFAPRLTDRYRVLAMTRRGNGASSRPATGYDITTLATDVRTVLDTLGVARVHLAGHSFGGDQITKFALLFPDRLRSLVYLDAAHDRKDLGRGPPGPPRVPPTADDSASLGAIRAYLARVNGTSWPEAEVRAFYRFGPGGRVVGRATGGAGPMNTEIAKSQEHPDYARIQAPALAIYAPQPRPEQAFPTYHTLDAQGRELADRSTDYWYKWARVQIDAFKHGIRDGQAVEFVGANHFVFVSHETEVLRVMREFFERHRAN